MILSQIAPHRLAAAPEPMRSLRLPEECGHAPEEGCDCAEAAAAAEQGAAIMKEVASLQVGREGAGPRGTSVWGRGGLRLRGAAGARGDSAGVLVDEGGGVAAGGGRGCAGRRWGADCDRLRQARPQASNVHRDLPCRTLSFRITQDMASLGGDDDGALDDDDSSSTNFGDASGGGAGGAGRFLELRCVLAVVRHGDRTPKQKMKMPVTQVRHPGVSLGWSLGGHPR